MTSLMGLGSEGSLDMLGVELRDALLHLAVYGLDTPEFDECLPASEVGCEELL